MRVNTNSPFLSLDNQSGGVTPTNATALSDNMLDVLVIGAGQAGLAAGYALSLAGLKFKILEASDRAAGSWPHYYDSLKLFSPARFSSLPGLAFPGDPERYPLRDEVIAYLESYAKQFDFPIVFQSQVQQIVRDGKVFSVSTHTGQTFRSLSVIAASGPFNQPNIPAFLGLNKFNGTVLHSSSYTGPTNINGNRVAIVGAGNSAVQIAYELSHTHQVVMTARKAPKLMPQRPLGKDLHFWLTHSRLDSLPLGDWLSWELGSPVLDPGIYRHAFANGTIRYRPLFDRVASDGLQWGDVTEPFDTLILATGFINSPAYLQGLDGLEVHDAAEQKGGIGLHVPGLYFVGKAWQRAHASATLRGVGSDAKYVVKHIQHYLHKSSVR